MQAQPYLSTPFPTRDMLNFAGDVSFSLRVRSMGAATTNLQLRGLTRQGLFTFIVPTLNDSSLQQSVFRLPDLPIYFSVMQDANSLVHAQMFVTVDLLVNGVKLLTMASGNVGGVETVDFPVTNNVSLIPNRGYFRIRSSTDPSAGNQISIAPPSGAIWRVHGISFTLVCAAAVANRKVHIVVSDTNTFQIDMISSVNQLTGETKKYSVAHYGAGLVDTDDNDILIHMPQEVWIPSGWTLGTTCTSMNAGDDFSAMDVLVEEFPFTPS